MMVDIPAGSITAILGTADSGKSTLLKFLAGCMDGNMVYDGVGESLGKRGAWKSLIRKRRTQNSSFFMDWSRFFAIDFVRLVEP